MWMAMYSLYYIVASMALEVEIRAIYGAVQWPLITYEIKRNKKVKVYDICRKCKYLKRQMDGQFSCLPIIEGGISA